MKKLFTSLLVLISIYSSAKNNLPVSADLVISQVYGGGGCMTAGCSTYKNDFIEIYNRGTSAVSLNGLSVQYGSTGSNGITITTGGITVLPDVSLQPGRYFLIAEGGSTFGINDLPAPDVMGTINMSASNGKVFLVNGTAGIALSATGCPVAAVIDFVGYGTANCSEGTPVAALSTTTSALRINNGGTDTDVNSADFTVGPPIPRNSSFFPAPVTLLNFTLKKSGNTNQLHWQVNCISTSVTFEMQRSSDGVNFKKIYRSAETKARCAAPFDYTDVNLLNGKNYYRLMIVDIDGSISYSKIVLATITKNEIILSVSPTIITNHATLIYNSVFAVPLQIIITDLQGRIVKKLIASVSSGENKINLNLNNLSAGQYYIKAYNSKEALPALQIIKQ